MVTNSQGSEEFMDMLFFLGSASKICVTKGDV